MRGNRFDECLYKSADIAARGRNDTVGGRVFSFIGRGRNFCLGEKLNAFSGSRDRLIVLIGFFDKVHRQRESNQGGNALFPTGNEDRIIDNRRRIRRGFAHHHSGSVSAIDRAGKSRDHIAQRPLGQERTFHLIDLFGVYAIRRQDRNLSSFDSPRRTIHA